MSYLPSVSPTPQESDSVLVRLQDSYARQKRLVAAQKRKQADIELQSAAAYFSDLPITLELLSESTIGLFTELENLLGEQRKYVSTVGKELQLLQRIRSAVNGELRQAMSFIEDGYHSAFERLMRQNRFDGRQDPSSRTPSASSTRAVSPHVVVKATPAEKQPSVAIVTVREALSEHVSLFAESLAVLLQCEAVRIYLYDEHENLKCAAQFPYRACRADPMHSSALALMAVREIHQTVCRDHLAINGTVGLPDSVSRSHSSSEKGTVRSNSSGLEDIRSCLIFPLLPSNGAGRSFGMIHAVNKHFPMVVDAVEKGSIEVPLRGFSLEDEILVSNAARLLGTTLSRYPADAFTNTKIGETLRSRAYPSDTQVSSLSAHLLMPLLDGIEEAAEIGKEAQNRALPSLIYRAPINCIFACRLTSDSRRISLSSTGGDHDASVSTVAFRLRCMNELWTSSRDDNNTLHQQYRTIEKREQRLRLLLRNVLDGIATARSMRVSDDVAEYLQTLEVYGRSERTERMANFVADKLLTLMGSRSSEAATPVDTSTEAKSSVKSSHDDALGEKGLRKLQHDHARLNTVTVASLHYDGPDGVPSYTSAPPQKREQVRFIDELRRGGGNTAQEAGTERQRSSGKGDGSSARHPSPQSSLPHTGPSARSSQKGKHPFQRPFKL
ncbi:hypothetical protein ABL78_2661 [Leptomonas seymouri]|uniref:GAF domain-containing protein n=1 Tax=Leptomonas seymouri TaxID=5684 RepID=A0A0N0P7E6_LEPSE|nr:hypothetical protein ABL78_2661 [Leptomonas seymouri]|eukprot:KPI88237.1 hypothetical protein ABL78_2661 [Leptomonas seymouri]